MYPKKQQNRPLKQMLTLLNYGPKNKKKCNNHIYHFHVLESPHLDFFQNLGEGEGEYIILQTMNAVLYQQIVQSTSKGSKFGR